MKTSRRQSLHFVCENGSSKDVRYALTVIGRHANEFENAFETFYNLAVSPATHVTFDIEAIKSASAAVDTAVVIGTRLQFDF